MEKQRREFLRTISAAAVLPALRGPFKPGVGATSSAATRDIRAHFPLLGESVNGLPLVYLDSAATTQRPKAVLDVLTNFYLHDNANPSKALHSLARRSAGLYEDARATVARFVNARGPEEIVFTRGTTEAINLVASSWGGANLGSGDEILLTICDHYSNFVPWQFGSAAG